MNGIGWKTVFILVACCFTIRAEDRVMIEVREKTTFTFVMSTLRRNHIDYCSVKSPNRAQPYLLDPLIQGDDINNRIKYHGNSGDPLECGVVVYGAEVKGDHGNWSVFITNTTGNYSEEFTVRVIVTTRDLVPKMPVSVVEGEDLYLRFEDKIVFNLEECRVNWTQREVVLKPGNTDDSLVAYWGAGLKEDCGVKATNISAEDAGTWILRARNSTGHVIEGTFTVDVLGKSVPDETDKIFTEGDYINLPLGPNNSLYCQVQPPTGQWGELKEQACDVELSKITKADGGKWTARYAIPGFVEEMETTLSVQIKARNYINTSIKSSSRHPGGLDLLCRWTTYEWGKTKTTYCRFIRPDGVALSLQDGTGNANYSYYGDGINFSETVRDCGVTIHNPKQTDVGSWQCIFGIHFQNIVKGGFLNVPANTRDQFHMSVKNNLTRGGDTEIIVKKQQPLIISCKATTSLNYCWFGHPNGTSLAAYSTTATVSSKKTVQDSPYSYSGQGLDLGDCTITIKEANHNDTGTWSCNMGVSDRADLKVLIDVRVVEGNMVAKVPLVGFANNDPPTIKCHTIPKGVALEYCRFVRPDGVGFGFKNIKDVVLDRYSYHGGGLEKGDCGLKIVSVTDVDFGQWTCAGLHVAETVEGKAHITLQDQRDTGMPIGLTGGSITGIVFGVIIAVILLGVPAVYIYRKRRSPYR